MKRQLSHESYLYKSNKFQRTRAPPKIPIRMSVSLYTKWSERQNRNVLKKIRQRIHVYIYGSLISHTKSSCENRVKFLWENKISWVCENFYYLSSSNVHNINTKLFWPFNHLHTFIRDIDNYNRASCIS